MVRLLRLLVRLRIAQRDEPCLWYELGPLRFTDAFLRDPARYWREGRLRELHVAHYQNWGRGAKRL